MIKIYQLSVTGGSTIHCVHCDFTCLAKDYLERHEAASRAHWEKWEFKCDLYEYSSNRRFNLRLHLSIHSGERPYGCDNCDKKFSRLTCAKIHRRTHTGERPYSCDVCGSGVAASLRLLGTDFLKGPPKFFGPPICDGGVPKPYILRTV